MADEGTSRRAILTGVLASAAVVGFGASRASATARSTVEDGITMTPLRADDCTYMVATYGVNQSGQMVGSGVIGGTTRGPLLWSGGTLSTPVAPDGARVLELVGISDSGRYAGAYDRSGLTAAVWTGGVPRPIRVGSFPHTRAALMDAAGRVVVQARTDPALPAGFEGWTWDRLFLHDYGRATPILAPDGAFWPDTRVVAMNNRGAVVAAVRQPGASEFAHFFWQRGRSTWLTDIGAAGSTVLPSAVNDHGQVAGTVRYSENGTQVERGFRWRAGRSELSPVSLPGAPDTGVTVADNLQAVNVRGDVVGYGSYGLYASRPFLWSGGTLTVLPVPEDTQQAWAWAVNDLGDVCGSYFSSTRGYCPCLWRAGQRIDLPRPGSSTGDQATHIDNHGLILSYFWRPANQPVDGVVSGGGSTGGGSTGGSSTSGGSASGGTSGGSTIEGATDDGATTGGTPGCRAATNNCVQWTVPF